MYYIDLMYLKQIANSLDRFKQISEHVFNCRCPLCGDSQKKESKARGYFYKKDEKLVYKCHNCGVVMSFYSFLENQDSYIFKEYKMELFKANRMPTDTLYRKSSLPDFSNEVTEKKETSKKNEHGLLHEMFDCVESLPPDHPAYEYCISRKIPKESLYRIFFIDDMSRFENLSEKYKNSLREGESRLVLPMYNFNRELSGFTCRSLDKDSKLRYITLKVKENSDYLFGIETINTSRKVYIVEGPIDSLFLDNSVAVTGTGFNRAFQNSNNILMDNSVVVIDNQPRNREICKILSKFINNGNSVVIWPTSIKGKDINEMVLDGLSIDQVKSIIDSNTYKGLEAMAKFSKWKKC